MAPIQVDVYTRPLTAYCMLCFLLSWGSTLVAVGLDGIILRPSEMEEKIPVMVAAMLLGPSISGVVLSLTTYGGKQTMGKLRNGFRWKRHYPMFILLAPILVGLILGWMCATATKEIYTPAILIVHSEEKLPLILSGLVYGVAAGLFEEMGWSFFAVPEMLQQDKSILETGATIGLVWGLWHFFVAVMGSGDEDGNLSFDLFMPWIPWNLVVLPAYRILMVHVFEVTGRRMWPMVFMHGSLTASLPLILMPTEATGMALTSFYFVLGLALWTILHSPSLFGARYKQKDA